MNSVSELYSSLQGKLIVSCQASAGDAFRDSAAMSRFARAAIDGGAAGIRAEGVEDVRAIRAAVSVPIIGIKKSQASDGRLLITPSFEDARELVEAGADLIALDCTTRGQHEGALDRLRRVKAELSVPALADIATVEEAVAAAKAGADCVLSTMRGHTSETERFRSFDPEFIAALRSAVRVPVIAEGRIWTPDEARAATAAGAFAVIVGTAITRPREITRRFADAIESEARRRHTRRYFIGIDLGGTNIKSGIVSDDGELIASAVTATPAREGAEAVLRQLKKAARNCLDEARGRGITLSAIGLATAGWVNPQTGQVIYGTDNILDWTGSEPGREIRKACGLPTAVINDANAVAMAEKYFGAARGVDDFLCITLGTGVGGGIYLGGRLHQGRNFVANAVGHIQIENDGLPCACGKRGCLEAYANAGALERYAMGKFSSAAEIISAAGLGDISARQAIRTYARHLAKGCMAAIHLLDPALLIFAGGLTQNNPVLLADLKRELAGMLLLPELRRLEIRFSQLGYAAGVIGAAAAAKERTGHSVE
jgi:putative N-acetylmannosamine-6-phosphate epimerase/predicted NBD/HSP70 family sugar kinase